jgi:peptidyl-prolyl cis-trans isomerase SurA
MLQLPAKRPITVVKNYQTFKPNDMMKIVFLRSKLAYLFLMILFSFKAWSQDEVLLTIGDKPVMRTEFERIYHKNNQVEGYESKSSEEYLDLFINFKLKVLEAQQLGYDTMPSFKKELAGYREQLTKPYLQNQKLIDKFVQEAYDHTTREVNASHIMIKLSANSSPADTLKAYSRIMDVRNRIISGEPFEKIAKAESEDPSAKQNEGRLGWFSAFMMVYPFENAAYLTPVGEMSMPVRSRYGYHLIKVNNTRPAQGEIKLAHIMTRAGKNEDPEKIDQARQKIISYTEMLKNGVSFGEVAQKYSEDAGSSRSGGQMRWLRSGELPSNIEVQVFALKDSGDLSEPIQSDYGWHIFQLQGKRPVSSFDKMKSQLEERIMQDERGKIIEQAKIAEIKKESGYIEYPGNLDALTQGMDTMVYTGNWKPEVSGNLIEPVFRIGDREYSQMDLALFIIQSKRYRREESLDQITRRKCDEYSNRELIAFEKSRLEEKYPDFRYLMEEYHDGILLFNITDDLVWSKAVKDSAGLEAFFKQHQGDYYWKERADVSVYFLKDKSKLDQVSKLARQRSAKKWTTSEFINLICPGDSLPCLTVTDERCEKSDTSLTGKYKWKKGSVTVTGNDSLTKIVVVNALLAPMPKVLQEVRGQVTADYQNYLDQQWIAELRKKYPLTIDRNVLQHVN